MRISNRPRSWTPEQLRIAVKKSTSIRQVLAHLKLREAGGNYDQIKKYIAEYRLDSSHFTGKAWNKGMTGIGKPIIPLGQLLQKNVVFQSFKLKSRLFAAGLKKPSCEECGWAKKTSDGYLPVELHHINGNRHDNRLKNLLILCPNCHCLKPNHRGRGGRQKPLPVFQLSRVH